MCLSFEPAGDNPQSVPEGNIFHQSQQSASNMRVLPHEAETKTQARKLNVDTSTANMRALCTCMCTQTRWRQMGQIGDGRKNEMHWTNLNSNVVSRNMCDSDKQKISGAPFTPGFSHNATLYPRKYVYILLTCFADSFLKGNVF